MSFRRFGWWTATAMLSLGCLGPSGPGTLRLSVATTGEDPDLDGYSVELDGKRLARMRPEEVATFPVAEGRHQLVLREIDENCSADPAARQLDIAGGGAVSVAFVVHCLATGVEVTAVATGMDLDNRYLLRIDGGDKALFAADSSLRWTRLAPGSYGIGLADVAPNCVVAPPNPRTITVTTATVQPVSFAVSCSPLWKFAFVREDEVTLASADGSLTSTIGVGSSPAWSPGGTTLAFGCGDTICTLDLTTGRTTPMEIPLWGEGPAWRRSGSLLTFAAASCDYYYCSFAGLAEVRSDGGSTSGIRLPESVVGAADLSWSPTGDSLAFTCYVAPDSLRSKVCLVAPGGTGFRVFATSSGEDAGPSWRPDGTRIAFHTTRFNRAWEIVVADSAGGQLTRLLPGVIGTHPDWSPDGTKLVFGGIDGLFVVGANGSGLTRLTTGSDGRPAWRR
ncbi:MAG: hypothetical protein ACKVZ0_20395 [Gemmatimonadales bacterium]